MISTSSSLHHDGSAWINNKQREIFNVKLKFEVTYKWGSKRPRVLLDPSKIIKLYDYGKYEDIIEELRYN